MASVCSNRDVLQTLSELGELLVEHGLLHRGHRCLAFGRFGVERYQIGVARGKLFGHLAAQSTDDLQSILQIGRARLAGQFADDADDVLDQLLHLGCLRVDELELPQHRVVDLDFQVRRECQVRRFVAVQLRFVRDLLAKEIRPG